VKKLYKLSNGSWIDPSRIESITPMGRMSPLGIEGPIFPARVVVRIAGNCEVVDCDNEEQAQGMADELASLANMEDVKP
jgi:hypothetical protein